MFASDLVIHVCFSFFSSQTIAIAYKQAHPESVVVVQAYDSRPGIWIKASDSPSQTFRRYGFVDAIKELDPVGSLGLLDPDFKVLIFCFFCVGLLYLVGVLCFLFLFLLLLCTRVLCLFVKVCLFGYRSRIGRLQTDSRESSQRLSWFCPTTIRLGRVPRQALRPPGFSKSVEGRSIVWTMTRCPSSPWSRSGWTPCLRQRRTARTRTSPSPKAGTSSIG